MQELGNHENRMLMFCLIITCQAKPQNEKLGLPEN